MHLAVETMRQPGTQSFFCARQIDPCHANLRKSKLTGPGPDLGYELTAVERHASIVETRVLRDQQAHRQCALLLPDEAATQALAAALATSPALQGAIIELHGNLGAGKTTFTRHLLRALGVTGRIKSPTYAVVEPHETANFPVWHFDFYRFNDPREWIDAGLRDIYAGPGLKLAEWPEKAAGLLPEPDLAVSFDVQPDESRIATLTAKTDTGVALLERMKVAA